MSNEEMQEKTSNAEVISEGAASKALLYAALAKAQGNFPAIPKNREASIRPRDQGRQAYTFRYADLEATLAAVRPPLAAEGLCLLQIVNGTKLITTLGHESGQSICSEFEMAPWITMGDPKLYGITLAYFRRYQVNALLAIAADDDLDVNGEDPEDQVPKKNAAQTSVAQPTAKKDKSSDSATGPTDSGDTLKPGQLRIIRAKMKSAGITDEAGVAERFGVGNLEEISSTKVNDVIELIAALAEAA